MSSIAHRNIRKAVLQSSRTLKYVVSCIKLQQFTKDEMQPSTYTALLVMNKKNTSRVKD